MVPVRQEADLKIRPRGRDLSEELSKRRYSLREFMAYVGISPKSTGHARNIVLGMTKPNDEVQAKIDEFLEAVCPTCGCQCPPAPGAVAQAKDAAPAKKAKRQS